jgi:hypothetical protein
MGNYNYFGPLFIIIIKIMGQFVNNTFIKVV